VISDSFAFSASRRLSTLVSMLELSPPLQLGYLEVTVQEKLRSGWPGPFVKVEGSSD
jgi:hypothetical protein